MLICECCKVQDETVTVEVNPWNDLDTVQLCDNCYENTADNARERQGSWDDDG